MNICKIYKRISVISICLLLLYSCFTVVFASDITNNHIDAVLVIDTSNSMNGSDPKKIAVDGVKLFIDMLEYSGSRVGIIGFNDTITFKTGLKEINSFEDKQQLINDMGKINYIGYTDIGLALKEAERMLYSQGAKNNKPMIILFTDGYIETRGVSRTDEKSTSEVYEVLLGAKNNYPIYTIGLNNSGRVDKDLINKMANDTNGLSYMTNNSADLPEIFNMIFADRIKSNILNVGTVNTDGQNYNNIDINIPNNSVSEANIIMFSDNPIIDAKLTDPNNKEQKIGEGNNSIYFSSQGSYSMLKIINPEQGKWKLSIKGVSGDKVKINLLYNYDISLKAEMQASADVKKGEEIVIKGNLLANNQPFNDVELMKDFNAQLNVTDSNNKIIETLAMENINSEFKINYKLPDVDTKLNFQIDAAGAGFFRQSNILQLEIKNAPPTIINKLDTQYYLNFPIVHNSISINLYDYFKDDDSTELNFKAVSDNNEIVPDISNGILKLSTNKILSYVISEIKLNVSDPSGANIETSFNLVAFPLLSVIVVIIIVILLIIFIINIRKKEKANKQLLTGYFEYRFTVNGILQEQKYEPLYNYRGIVSLNYIIKDSDKSQMSDISNISVKSVKKEGQIMLEFKNKSNYILTSDFKSTKELILKFDEIVTISNVLDNSELQITYLEDLAI